MTLQVPLAAANLHLMIYSDLYDGSSADVGCFVNAAAVTSVNVIQKTVT